MMAKCENNADFVKKVPEWIKLSGRDKKRDI